MCHPSGPVKAVLPRATAGLTRAAKPDLAPTLGATLERAFMSFAACCAVAMIGALDSLHVPGLDPIFLVGSLGASAVLVFGAPESPMATARSVIGGHFVSALVGVACFRMLGETPYVSGGLAVGLAIFAMHTTRTLHAPGGATALIANIGSEKVKALGFGYAFAPVLSGVAILMVAALVARFLHGRATGMMRRESTSRANAADETQARDALDALDALETWTSPGEEIIDESAAI